MRILLLSPSTKPREILFQVAVRGSPLGVDTGGLPANLVAGLKPLLPVDTILRTDGSSVPAAAAKEIGITHRPVNVSAGRRAIAGVYHFQNVNAYDSRLKNWIRRLPGVASKYLDSYLGWFRKLDRSATAAPQPVWWLELALGKRPLLN